MTMTRHYMQYIGILCAVFAAIGYGAVPIFAKLYYEAGGSTATFMFVRLVICFLVFMPVISVVRQRSFLPPRECLAGLAIWNAVMLGLYITYFNAIEYLDASLVVILFFSYPLFVLLFEGLSRNEAIGRRQVIGAVTCFVGVCLVVTPKILSVSIGLIGVGLALLAAMIMAVNLILQKRLVQRISSYILLTSIGLYLVVPLGVYMVIDGVAFGPWHLMLWVCVISTSADICLQTALKFIGTVKSSSLMNFEPVIAAILGFAILGELLNIWQYGGCLIIFLSLFLIHKKRDHQKSEV